MLRCEGLAFGILTTITTKTTVLRSVLLPPSCPARSMRMHLELTILSETGEKQKETIELEMTSVLSKTVNGCDSPEQASSLCQHCVQPLLPLGLYKSVNMYL